MQITKNNLDTSPGSGDWFSGLVFVDTVAAPSEGSQVGAAAVHFTPGARTAWHTHRHGQTIWVTEGVGLCQREGGPIEMIRPGDRVFFEPAENHWHGAGADPLDDPRRDPAGRRQRQRRRVGPARQRRRVRAGAVARGR